MTPDKRLNQQRILAFGFDWIVINLLSRFLTRLLLKIEFISLAFSGEELIAVFLVIFMCGKDVLFKNASLGKRLFGLIVVKKSGYPPSTKQLLLRNVLLTFLSPLEIYRYFIAKDEIYGDVLAGTKVVYRTEQP